MPQAGITARLWRPFEDSLAEARCLHLFGTAAEFLPVVESARRSGVKVVLSPESWRNDADRGPYPRGRLRKTAAWFAKAGRGVFSRVPVWQRELYAAVDLLLPNSNVEAQRIARRFKLPLDRLRVIPHGVDPHLAEADPELFCQHAGVRDFVLYAGSVEPNNQQLGFLWAMKEFGTFPLVILGDVAPQCQWYLDECRRVAVQRPIPPAVCGQRSATRPVLMRPAAAWSWEAVLPRPSGLPWRPVPRARRWSCSMGAVAASTSANRPSMSGPMTSPASAAACRRPWTRKRSKNLAEYVCTVLLLEGDRQGVAGCLRTGRRAPARRAAEKGLQAAGK